jgi:hypothetical protein
MTRVTTNCLRKHHFHPLADTSALSPFTRKGCFYVSEAQEITQKTLSFTTTPRENFPGISGDLGTVKFLPESTYFVRMWLLRKNFPILSGEKNL